MRIEEGIYISSDHMEVPEWVEINLDATDHKNISFAKAILADNEFIQTISIDLHGKWSMNEIEGNETTWDYWDYWELVVTRYNIWFKCTNDYSGDYFEVTLES